MAEKPGHDNDFFLTRREQALERLLRRISQPGLKPPEKLHDYQLKQYDIRQAVAGWEFYPPMPAAPGRCLRIFVDNRFPFSVPKIAVFPEPHFLKYPHIERDGYLCIDEKARIVDEERIEDIVGEIIDEALDLVDQCFSGKNQSDFQDEILSYWDRASGHSSKKIFSLLNPRRNHDATIVKIWRGEEYYLISHSEDEAKQWLENKSESVFKGTLQEGLLVWPIEPLGSPTAYPKTSIDVYNFIKHNCDESALHMFEAMTIDLPEKMNVVFGFETKDGPALIGLNVHKPNLQTHGKITKSETFNKGFRPGKVPPKISAGRYMGNAPVEKMNVQRVDPSWILNRDSDKKTPILLGKKVTLIGCGAIGSVLARLLAQAGIGLLNLVDPDKLEWENTGRHALGVRSIGMNSRFKTDLLANSLTSDFPHLVVNSYSKEWETIAAESPDIFSGCDLVVTTTGEWSADNAMNQYSLNQDNFPPVIYGWTEPFACAGHAVFVLKDSGCLDCVFKGDEFSMTMTGGFEKELFRVPACSITFQPFGSIELTPIVGMIAEISIDALLGRLQFSQIRSWLGSAQQLKDRGGKWTDMAETLVIARSGGQGYFRIASDLKKTSDCRSCSKSKGQGCVLQTGTKLQSGSSHA